MPSNEEYASSPCMWHELASAADGRPAGSADSGRDVAEWRKAERRTQLERRRTIPLDDRRRMAEEIGSRLIETIASRDRPCVSLFWPIRGEPDLRQLADRIASMGGSCALPVVVERARPLQFHAWAPGDRLVRGFWDIPVPAAVRQVVPDVVFAPVVAFDRSCFRLGYGGGYFDRTLAAMPQRPLVVGVGYSEASIATIYPQPHDIPMDLIVTNDAVHRRVV